MKICSICDFYRFLEDYCQKPYKMIFRGVRSSKYKLIPSIGRIQRKGQNVDVEEEKLSLKIFKHRSYPFTKEFHHDNLELLSIAQHHGMPTRLLDWTKNPLVSVYFAVENPLDEAKLKLSEYSAVYVYKTTRLAKLDSTFDPFRVQHVERFVPKHWNARITSQGGSFTVHPEPHKAWKPKKLEIVKIHHCIRNPIKKILDKLGVNAGTIYPGLDGIAQHVKWLRSDNH